MKKLLYLSSVLICIAFVSCYEDKSTTELKEIHPIVINLENISERYTVSQYDSLTITPTVFIKDSPDASLKYKWTLRGNTIEPIVLDSTMHLRTKISVMPQSGQYGLVLEVTDSNTGLQKFKQFFVTVKAALAEGLVVADTKDGIHSDLSVIVSRHFSYSKKWPDTKVFKHIYSSTNGTQIEGLVKEVRTRTMGQNRTLTVMTDKSILRADHYDYKRIDKECDKGMFMFPPKEELNPYFIELDTYYGNDLVCVNGIIYPRPTQNNSRLCTIFIYPAGRMNYHITHSISIMYGPVWFFDTLKESFIMLSQNVMQEPKTQNPNAAFDLNNFKGYEPIFFGQPDASEVHFIMRHKPTGDIKDFVGTTAADNGNNVPKRVIDLSNTPEIKNAKYFTMGQLESRLYYATESTLYSVSLENGNHKVQYTPQQGEKITGIKMWTEYGGYIKNKDAQSATGFKEIASNNRMMMVMTYNESTKEGKLILVPVATVNAELEQDRTFHVEYGGFGKILKVNKQDR